MTTYVQFCRYSEATGLIQAVGSCPLEILPFQARQGQPVLQIDPEDGVSRDAHHVVGGVVVPRPPLFPVVSKTTIEADGVDQAVISNLPAPSYARVGDLPTLEVVDGSLEITADTAGDIPVSIDAPPHLLWETTIVAVEPAP